MGPDGMGRGPCTICGFDSVQDENHGSQQSPKQKMDMIRLFKQQRKRLDSWAQVSQRLGTASLHGEGKIAAHRSRSWTSELVPEPEGPAYWRQNVNFQELE